MIDRTQLTEALAHWQDIGPINGNNLAEIEKAARMVRDFPTDEMVEALAVSIYESENGGEWQDWKGETILQRQMWLDIARAGLEAVRRIMYGED